MEKGKQSLEVRNEGIRQDNEKHPSLFSSRFRKEKYQCKDDLRRK